MSSIVEKLATGLKAAEIEIKLLRKKLEVEQECVNKLNEALWQICSTQLPHGNPVNHIDFLRKIARDALNDTQ
jgi:hypothetical protein